MLLNMEFPGRKFTFPIVLDDKWNKEALERYMHSIRDKAVYLPSNIEYLARNNGVEGGAEEALKLLVASPWVSYTFFSLLDAADSPLSSCSELVSILRAPSWFRCVFFHYGGKKTSGAHTQQVDPRCRLVGQKMNPSRTFTPRVRFRSSSAQAAV